MTSKAQRGSYHSCFASSRASRLAFICTTTRHSTSLKDWWVLHPWLNIVVFPPKDKKKVTHTFSSRQLKLLLNSSSLHFTALAFGEPEGFDLMMPNSSAGRSTIATKDWSKQQTYLWSGNPPGHHSCQWNAAISGREGTKKGKGKIW